MGNSIDRADAGNQVRVLLQEARDRSADIAAIAQSGTDPVSEKDPRFHQLVDDFMAVNQSIGHAGELIQGMRSPLIRGLHQLQRDHIFGELDDFDTLADRLSLDPQIQATTVAGDPQRASGMVTGIIADVETEQRMLDRVISDPF